MSERNTYFEEMKALARNKRKFYNVDTVAFGLREVRRIYKTEGIKIDYYPLPTKIKALYVCANGNCSVAIRRKLPDEPKLFALIHELKHHYCDQKTLGTDPILCGDYNRNELIEIGAEVFAAEFIYPREEFVNDINALNIKSWQVDDVVNLKRNCKAKVSYQFICKRLKHLGLVSSDQFKGVKFRNLEDKLFGLPYHRQRKLAIKRKKEVAAYQ